MPCLNLNARYAEPFELAAAMIAAVAYSPLQEEDRFLRFEHALRAYRLHEQNRVDRSDDPFVDARHNECLSLPRLKAFAIFEKGLSRLNVRRQAAQFARPWVHDHLVGTPHRPVEGVSAFSANQIGRHLVGGADPANFLERVWRKSRPVIHLAIAFDLLTISRTGVEMPGRRGVKAVPVSVDDLPAWREAALNAIALQDAIVADRRFGIAPEAFLWLRWNE